MAIGYIITDCAHARNHRGPVSGTGIHLADVRRRPAANNLQYSLRSTRKFMRARRSPLQLICNPAKREGERRRDVEKNTFFSTRARARERNPRSLIFHYSLFITGQLQRRAPATCSDLFDNFSDDNYSPFPLPSFLIQIAEIIYLMKAVLKIRQSV